MLAFTPLGHLWQEARTRDVYLSEVKASILRGDRRFPPALRVGPSMSECSVDPYERLRPVDALGYHVRYSLLG